MLLHGRVFKGSTMWVAEAPIVGVFTQGKTRKEADEMLVDAIEEVVHREGFKATIVHRDGDEVLIDANDQKALAAYVLKYQREVSGLSLADVAKKLGQSRQSFAAYEQGRVEPTLTKFKELLAAVAPDMELVVQSKTKESA